MFTTEDLAVFSTLANQAAVASENARFYEEERQRQAVLFHAATLASLGTMASGMSHQVNNRFNVVSLISSIQKVKLKALLDNGASGSEELRKAIAECLEQFESLEEEAMRGGQVVASIRKLARPSTDGYKPLTLFSAVKAGMDVVQHKVRFDDLDFHLDLPEDLPPVRGDLSQLGECFLNLIDNAYDAIKTKEQLILEGKLQHTDEGRPYRGSMRIRAVVKDPRTIQVDIADNGMGIVPEDLPKLFIPFHTTKATAEKGTGLGLYVIKQVVEAHGGTIRLQSKHGHGTTFTMELPTARTLAGSPVIPPPER
jgi:signal transduction histidine kinase